MCDNKQIFNITIVGAGAVGLQFAVHCKEAGHNVTIYTKKSISSEISLSNELGEVIHTASGIKSSFDEQICFGDADLIFITYPAFMMNNIANIILPFANNSKKIFLVPGTGGGEFAFKACIERGCVLFGLQRVPSVARIISPGKKVKVVGYRSELCVSSIPVTMLSLGTNILNSIFKMKVTMINNYLGITLTPSNPILHPSRLYSLFKNYSVQKTYMNIPLFYETWDDYSSEILLSMDEEVQALCNSLPFDLKSVKSLKEHYESYTYKELTTKIRSIKGFKGLYAPMKVRGDGYIPDFDNRYFKSDFDFGLSIIIQIAKLANVSTPTMDLVYNWYKCFSPLSDSFSLHAYSIDTLNDLIRFYDNILSH